MAELYTKHLKVRGDQPYAENYIYTNWHVHKLKYTKNNTHSLLIDYF